MKSTNLYAVQTISSKNIKENYYFKEFHTINEAQEYINKNININKDIVSFKLLEYGINYRGDKFTKKIINHWNNKKTEPDSNVYTVELISDKGKFYKEFNNSNEAEEYIKINKNDDNVAKLTELEVYSGSRIVKEITNYIDV